MPGPSEPIAPGTVPATRGGYGLLTNSAVNIGGLVLANGLGALSGLIVARTLGPAGVGVLAVIVGVIEFGRTFSNFTHSPSILAFHRERDADRVFGTSFAIKIAGAALYVALMALAAPYLGDIFNVPAWAILLMSATLLVGVPFEIGTARLEAENRMVKRNVIMIIGPALGLTVVIGLAIAEALTVYTVIFSSLLATAAMSIAAFSRVTNPFRLRVDRTIGKYLAGYGVRLLAISFLTQVLIWTDTLMISGLEGNGPAGVYNVAYQITFIMVTVSTAVGTALMPALSELAGRGEDTSTGYARGSLITLATSVALALAYALLGRSILGIFGAGFVEGYVPLLILTVFGAASALAVPPASLLTVHGHAGALTWISVGQVVLNLPLNYVLITSYGITGAAVATTTVAVLGLVALWGLAWRTTQATPFTRAVLREAFETPGRFLKRRP